MSHTQNMQTNKKHAMSLMDIHAYFLTLSFSDVLTHTVHSTQLDPDCLAPQMTLRLSVATVMTSPFVLHRPLI